MRSPGPTHDVSQNRQEVKERYIALVRSVRGEACCTLMQSTNIFLNNQYPSDGFAVDGCNGPGCRQCNSLVRTLE